MRSFTRAPRPTQRRCSAELALFLLAVLLPRTILLGAAVAVCALAACVPLRRRWQQTRRLAPERDSLLRSRPVHKFGRSRCESKRLRGVSAKQRRLCVLRRKKERRALRANAKGWMRKTKPHETRAASQTRTSYEHVPTVQVEGLASQFAVPGATVGNVDSLTPIIEVGVSDAAAQQALDALTAINGGEILCDDDPAAGDCAPGIGCDSNTCLLYTSPSPRDRQKSRMPSSA